MHDSPMIESVVTGSDTLSIMDVFARVRVTPITANPTLPVTTSRWNATRAPYHLRSRGFCMPGDHEEEEDVNSRTYARASGERLFTLDLCRVTD